MNTTSLVSIGLPVYNGEQFIKKAIDSILSQSFSNFELIISDNASTDSTLQICKTYADRDDRIKVLEQRHNIGALENFKFVLNQATGSYFMWAAVDDSWDKDFISKLLDVLENNKDAIAAMCAVNMVGSGGSFLRTIRFSNDVNKKGFYHMLKKISSPLKYNIFIYGLYRRELIQGAITVFRDVPSTDRLFICQIVLAYRFKYLDEVLHTRFVHEISASVRYPNEKFSLKAKSHFVRLKTLVELIYVITNSSIIPWNRRLLLPVALWRFAVLLYFPRLSYRLYRGIN